MSNYATLTFAVCLLELVKYNINNRGNNFIHTLVPVDLKPPDEIIIITGHNNNK